MKTADFRERTEAFKKDVAALEQDLQTALTSGVIPEELKERADGLKKREEVLLLEALPLARRKRFFKRDPRPEDKTLVPAPEDGKLTKTKLLEAGLSDEALALAGKLLDGEEAEPILPDCDLSFLPDLYLAAGTGDFAFLFSEEGQVYLAENNDGWMVRREPIFTECFAEGALPFGSHAVMILDLDHAVRLLSYSRLETIDALRKESIYGG